MKHKTQATWVLRALWLLVPVVAVAWHFGPGKNFFHQDLAAEHVRAARLAVDQQNWALASTNYALAAEQWPETSSAARQRTELAEANARILSGDLISGQQQLRSIITEIENQTAEDVGSSGSKLLLLARHDLATSAYYAAWIMRLEGAETEEWLQEAEVARQQFRLLAEADSYDDDETCQTAAENLEATIRLEQMDIRTLMAKPLPKNCCSNCDRLCQKKRKQAASRCKNTKDEPGEKKRQDVRKEIKKTNEADLREGEGTGS